MLGDELAALLEDPDAKAKENSYSFCSWLIYHKRIEVLRSISKFKMKIMTEISPLFHLVMLGFLKFTQNSESPTNGKVLRTTFKFL